MSCFSLKKENVISRVLSKKKKKKEQCRELFVAEHTETFSNEKNNGDVAKGLKLIAKGDIIK